MLGSVMLIGMFHIFSNCNKAEKSEKWQDSEAKLTRLVENQD